MTEHHGAAKAAEVIAMILGALIAVCFVVWDIWFIIVWFMGGRLPVPWDWTTDPNWVVGLIWIFGGSAVFFGVAAMLINLVMFLVMLPFHDVLPERDD